MCYRDPGCGKTHTRIVPISMTAVGQFDPFILILAQPEIAGAMP